MNWSRLNMFVSRAQLTQQGTEGDASFRRESMDLFYVGKSRQKTQTSSQVRNQVQSWTPV